MTTTGRTVFPVFMSRWKGNSDAKSGSVVVAITLESRGSGNPGRLIGTIPLRLCAHGRYWFAWEDSKHGREGKILASDLHHHDHRSVGRTSGSDPDNVPWRPRSKRDLQ